MSISSFNITPTTMITNHNNEQYTDITLNNNETINVNDGRQNQRDKVKGERENIEDDVKRRERTRHTNKNTDSVTSYTNEQYNSSIVNNSIGNHFSSNFNSNMNYQTIFLSNNRHFHDYKPSHRFHKSSHRKTHYLDDSDEEIIKEEILEIINFNHYPTLIERWGDDTRPIIKQQGEYQIEDYVEFEEIEPTITEEISYEIIYVNDQIQSTREIRHSYSKTRNFQKIKKRRIKRKQTTSSIDNLSTINSFTQAYEIIPSVINRIQSSNLDLIDEDTSVQKNEDQSNIEEINQSHVSWNDIISRIDESSINQTNDNHTETSEKEIKLQSTVSEVNQNETDITHIFKQETTELIEQKVENPSLNSLIEITEQIETIPLTLVSKTEDSTVQYTCKDERSSDLNIISTITKSAQKPFYDNEETNESLAMLVNIHLPTAKTETRYTEKQTDEKLITDLTYKVDKESEAASIQLKTTITPKEELSQPTYDNTNELITTNSAIETAKIIPSDKQQPSISPKTEKDENVEQSSDFLADIIRQIITKISTTHRLPINHTKQVAETLTEITEPTGITSIPTANIEDNVSNQLELLTSPVNSETLLNTDQNSISDTHDNFQQCIEINPINQTTTELTNIMNSILNLSTKTLSEELQQSETIEQISSPKFSISEISTPSETDLNDLYQHRYFPFTTIEQTLSNINLLDHEQSDEKKITADLTKIYYELQEQRQIPSVLNEKQTKQKQETSDVNVNNHIEHFHIKSFSYISNLPTKEYRQIFGVSDEIVNTVADLTYYVDQTFQPNTSNEKSEIIETPEDHQSIVSTDQEELIDKVIPSVTSDIELDFRYTSLLDRINTLIKPLLDLSAPLFINENELISSNINEDKDASTKIDYTTMDIADVVSNIATNSSLTTKNEEITISSDTNASNVKDIQSKASMNTDCVTSTVESTKRDDEVYTSTVIHSEIIISKSSEEIETKEIDNQQSPSSRELVEIMKDLSSSTFPSRIATETSLERIQSVIKAQQQQDTMDKLVNNIDLSTAVTNQQQKYSIEDQKLEVSKTPLQSPAMNDEEHHGVLDLVINPTSNAKETVLDLDSSDEKTPSNIPDNSIDNTQQSKVPDNNEKQQNVTEIVAETINNTYENTVLTQEQVIQASKQQILYNDRWYSNYYTIVDAEANIARLYKQLNLFNDQSTSPTKVEIQNELQDEQDENEDDLHIVQRRKRIPSSTTHEKIVSTNIITTKSMISQDIDLEPVILHGHPDVIIPISSIIPQATNTISKKKHKKKKKDIKEMILFDAPEPTSSDINKQKFDTTQSEIEEETQKNLEMNDSVFISQILDYELEQTHLTPTIISDDQESEVFSTSILSNTDASKQIDDKINELTSFDISQLLPTPITKLPESVKVNAQLIEQQPTDKDSILQSSLPTTKTIRTKVIVPSKEEEEDDDGFQLVHYRKRILSAAKSEQTPPSTPNSKEILSPDIDQKIPVTFEHQSLPTSKKKRNKHKKHKKEIDSSSDVNSSKSEQEPTLQAHIPSSAIIEHSDSTLSPTIKTTAIHTTPSALPKEEEEEDDEGFQVVSYRRRITSASRFANTPPSSLTKTKYKQNISRNNDRKPVVLHGRHGSASPSISCTTISPKTPSNQNKQVKPKENKKQTSSLSTPPRSISAETHIITSTGTDRTPKNIKLKTEHQQQLKNSKRETILDEKPKLDQSKLNEQSTKQIVKEHHVSPKTEINTADQQPPMEKIALLTTLNDGNTDTGKSTLIENDNDEFQIAHHQEDILSSTISAQSNLTFTIDQESTDTYAESNSSSSTTTTLKTKLEKPKITDDSVPSLLTINMDSIPLSIEETIDKKANDDIQQVTAPQITSTNNSSNSNEATLINTTYKTITSEITEPVYQIDNAQSALHSIQSATSSTTAIEEVFLPSNELPGEVNNLSITQPVGSTNISLPTSNQIEQEQETVSTINIEDEYIKTTSNKKATRRRKKKSHTKEKLDDENISTSATNIPVIPNNIESNDIKIESNWNRVENSKSTTSEELNNKLDLFLPEYIRQQINTYETNSSIPNAIITSSDTIEKKKQRPKMLRKDYEAKSLLTNEFDNTIDTETPSMSIDDDDEFIIQNFDSNISTINSTEQTIDNILSRGFYLWLQESQAISQQSSNNNLTNIMQSIVIQPTTITTDDDEDKDSRNVSKSTYMIGIHPKKRIHITNAYFINHPEFISTPSWVIAQSNKTKFQDISDNEEDSMNDTLQKSTNLNNFTHQQTNSTTKRDNNPSINFDDWAHFVEDKNSYHIGDDLSTSLECFYTQTLDEDTLLSDTIPIQHSIKTEQQRYGDFSSSNNNNESMIQPPLCKSKPSEYFQNWRKQESNSISHQNDDEIYISHSNNGLSRQIKP